MPVTEIEVPSADKYKQVCEDFRFYGDMRFKQLTLFSAVTVLLLNVTTAANPPLLIAHHSNKTVVGIAGMLFTAVLWIMEVRSTRYALQARAEKDKIERRDPREREWVTASNAVLFLYAASYFFWFRLLADAGDTTLCRALTEIIFGCLALGLCLYAELEIRRFWRFHPQ
jgi:hypothetical protein